MQVVFDAIAQFVRELRAGGPMRSGAAQPKAAPAKSVDAAAAAARNGGAAAANSAAAAAAEAAAAEQAERAEREAGAKKEAAAAGSGHSIRLTERFFAGAAGGLWREEFCLRLDLPHYGHPQRLQGLHARKLAHGPPGSCNNGQLFALPLPAELYECFTVPPRMMAYTQSPAEAEPRPVSAAAVA